MLSVYRDHGVVPKASRVDNFNKPGVDLDSYLHVRQGDLVINKMKAWQGSIAVSEFEGIVSPAYFAFAVDPRVDGRFLHHLLRAEPYIREYARISSGVRPNQWDLDLEQFGRIDVLLPALTVQRTIAGFLDRKTAAIEAVIEEKERLSALLTDKRAALIHRAVTKGLDPTVPTRDSGAAWIGLIPVHWDATLLRLLARIESGHTPSRSHPEYWVPAECTIPWFSLADVWQLRDAKQTFLGETSERISPRGMANSAARLLPAGTVVLSRTASVGFSGIMPRPMATTQDFVNWVCGDRLDPLYLLWTFRAMSQEFERLMMGSTHQTIYMPDARQFRGPVPPLWEQRAIVAFLDRETGRIDATVEKTEAHIALLREYRQSLITAAVTGQLPIPA